MNASSAAGLVPLHIGITDPANEPFAPTVLGMSNARPEPARDREGTLAVVAWRRLGAEPRWLGNETSECAAALTPSNFHNAGADELRRFRAGAAARQETALFVATIGRVGDDIRRLPMAQCDASVAIPPFRGTVGGTRLPTGVGVELAGGLAPAERDLGLRLRNRPPTSPWWSLTPPSFKTRSNGIDPDGDLHPILVDSLGDPVAAVWVPRDLDERWYIIPDGTDWDSVVDWLVSQAIPAYVPGVLRRVRAPQFDDPQLETRAEAQAKEALVSLEARYAEEKAHLEEQLREAREAADPVRYGLLFGTDKELENAVATVLCAAGFVVVDLDAEIGPQSADLLVQLGEETRLVEVKSAGGAAPEALVGKLLKHLQTWPSIRPGQPVGGGVLAVNHQHKQDPADRSPQVYNRREFVDALTVPVLSSRSLFDWWRSDDWPAIRAAVLGQSSGAAETAPRTDADARELLGNPSRTAPVQRRRWSRLFAGGADT